MKLSKQITFFCLAILAGIAFGLVFSGFMKLPQIESLEEYRPSEVSRIFADDGTVIDELFIERRKVVPFDRIPLHLKQAVIAVEDSRFYSHSGIDFRGIARALVVNITAGRVVQGGSTITQQLSKVLFFSPERTLIRKIKEAIVTLQIEKRYTKDQILALYLNQIFFGGRIHGISSAARFYFGKRVEDLNISESALLAGMVKGPNLYSPFNKNRPDAWKKRQSLWVHFLVELKLS